MAEYEGEYVCGPSAKVPTFNGKCGKRGGQIGGAGSSWSGPSGQVRQAVHSLRVTAIYDQDLFGVGVNSDQ